MATAREQQEAELREQQERNDRERRAYRPAEVHADTIAATNAKGDEAKSVEIHAFGGHVYLNSHGEARFDRDAWHAFLQQGEAAFQAVA